MANDEKGFGDRITQGIVSEVTGRPVRPDPNVVNSTLGAIGGVPLGESEAKDLGFYKGVSQGLGIAQQGVGLIQAGQSVVSNYYEIEKQKIQNEILNRTKESEILKSQNEALETKLKVDAMAKNEGLKTSFLEGLNSKDPAQQKAAILDPKYAPFVISNEYSALARGIATDLDSRGLLNPAEKKKLQALQSATGFLKEGESVQEYKQSFGALRADAVFGPAVDEMYSKKGVREQDIVRGITFVSPEEYEAGSGRGPQDITGNKFIRIDQGEGKASFYEIDDKQVQKIEKARAALVGLEDKGVINREQAKDPSAQNQPGAGPSPAYSEPSKPVNPLSKADVFGKAAPLPGPAPTIQTRPFGQQVKQTAPAAPSRATSAGSNPFGQSQKIQAPATQAPGPRTSEPAPEPEKIENPVQRGLALLKEAGTPATKMDQLEGFKLVSRTSVSFENDPNAQEAFKLLSGLDEDQAREVTSEIGTILRVAPRTALGQEALRREDARSYTDAKTQVAKRLGQQEWNQLDAMTQAAEEEAFNRYVRDYNKQTIQDWRFRTAGVFPPGIESPEDFYYFRNREKFNSRVNFAATLFANEARGRIAGVERSKQIRNELQDSLRNDIGGSMVQDKKKDLSQPSSVAPKPPVKEGAPLTSPRTLSAGLPSSIDDRLIDSLAYVESRFDPKAVSPRGAKGILQIMPFMQKAYGLEDPFDPKQAFPVAKAILGDELNRFKDMRLAVAAYNLGATKLTKLINRLGTRDWNKIRAHAPEETRDYVDKVLSAYTDEKRDTYFV